MGRVWVAYHHRLKTRIAVKFVHEKLVGDDVIEARARFEQEAAIAAQIKSSNVVQTYDSGIAPDGAPYIVMELLEGQSLGDRLREGGPLEWNEAATILAQVARALTKAHELGVVHRDIKPDNIFLCRAEDGMLCKVLDFGVAKQTQLPAMGGLTTDGKLVGTPEFMSPELVLEDKPVDYRADLWALGVVMYAGLTGQLPYTGKTLGQLCLNLVNRIPTSPSALRPGLPPQTDEWFARCLHRHSSERFHSAREMAVTFAALLGGSALPVDLRSPTLLGVAIPDSSRESRNSFLPGALPNPTRNRFHTALVGSLVAVGLLLLLGAGYVLTRSPTPIAKATDGRLLNSAIQEFPAVETAAIASDAVPATSSSESAVPATIESSKPSVKWKPMPTPRGSATFAPVITPAPKAPSNDRNLGF